VIGTVGVSISPRAVRRRIEAAISAAQTETEDAVQYVLLIYSDPAAMAEMSEADRNAFMGEYFAYTEGLRQAGVFVGGEPLESTDTATTVRQRDGKQLVTDGPFAETREVLGGFYLLECDSLDAALEHAGRCPGARIGSIEVRPVMAMPATA
jgi:hypothetical protein